jgi:hypothetical protein
VLRNRIRNCLSIIATPIDYFSSFETNAKENFFMPFMKEWYYRESLIEKFMKTIKLLLFIK